MALIRRDKRTSSAVTSGTALALARANPHLAAAVSKTTSGRVDAQHDYQGNRVVAHQELYAFNQALLRRANQNVDADAVKKMLPDLALAEQILVSSILSPKDMINTELIYTASTAEFRQDLLSSLIGRLSEHFKKDYPIEPELSTMLSESLVSKGSYPVAVFPENAIDQLINQGRNISTESIDVGISKFIDLEKNRVKPLGVLGDGKPAEHIAKSLGLEAFVNRYRVPDVDQRLYTDVDFHTDARDPNVVVIDNPMVLSMSKISDHLRKRSQRERYSTAFESESQKKRISDRTIERFILRRRQPSNSAITEMPSQMELKRSSVGLPLVMKFPTESVMPIHVPSDPKKQIGFYIVLDENGFPVSTSDADLFRQVGPGTATSATSAQTNLIQRAAMNLGLTDPSKFDMNSQLHMRAAVRVYSDMVERDLINRIRNGIGGITAKIAGNDEIYRLMLARSLSGRFTQVLYVPAEYMTYIAFNYSSDGLGRAILDEQAMINMFRVTSLMAEVIGSIKNSIGRTKVTGTLDPNDPDPIGTQEKIIHELVNSRQLNLPMKLSQPADIMAFVQQAGFEFNFSGHSGMPDMKLEFDQVQTNYQKPDEGMMEKLQKSSIMGFSLSPETVEKGFNSEFATQILTENVLLAKRVSMLQKTFCPQLTDHMRKHARHSPQLVEELRDILDKNADKILIDVQAQTGVTVTAEEEKEAKVFYALERFLDTFEVNLPEPSSVTLESQSEELNKYADLLDKALDSAFVGQDMFSEAVAGEASQQIGTLKAHFKALLMRKFMTQRGILTELSDITSSNLEGNPQDDISKNITDFVEGMTKLLVNTYGRLSSNRTAANNDLSKLDVKPPDNMGSTDTGLGDGGFGAGDDLDPATTDDNPNQDDGAASDAGTSATDDGPEAASGSSADGDDVKS